MKADFACVFLLFTTCIWSLYPEPTLVPGLGIVIIPSENTPSLCPCVHLTLSLFLSILLATPLILSELFWTNGQVNEITILLPFQRVSLSKFGPSKMENNQNGRQPKWKTTKMEDSQNGRRPK